MQPGFKSSITPLSHPNAAGAPTGQPAGEPPANDDAARAPALLAQRAESSPGMANLLANRSGPPATGAAASQPAFRPDITTTLNAATPLTTTTTTTTTTAYSPPSSPATAMAPNAQAPAQRASQLASLYKAIERNDLQMLSQALDGIRRSGKDVAPALNSAQIRHLSGIGRSMLTPLMTAAWFGHERLIKVLIQAGAKVDQTMPSGWTALMVATQKGHTDIVQALIDACVKVDLSDTGGWTALMLAAQYGHTDIVQALLKAGAMVNLANTDGRVALMFAAHRGHTAAVQALIDAGAKVDQDGSDDPTALMLAAENGHTPAVQALVRAGARVDQEVLYGTTALMVAVQKGRAATVQALIQAGAKVDQANTSNWTSLMVAAQNGHTTIVQALTKAGARPDLTNISGQTALMLAAQKGRTATVQALIKAGADIHIHAAPNQRTALGIAIGRKRALVVELLVRHGARQASSQPGMVEAFIVALATGSGQVLQALFDGGLDPTPEERKAIRQSNQQADPKLLQLVAAGCKSLAARIYDAHHAGQHQQANQLIGEHLRNQPTHPLGLASCATWLIGSGKPSWRLAPGSGHAMASLLAGHDMQRARRLFSHGLRSEVVAAIITAWDSVADAVAHLATLTASGRIRVAGAAPEDALFAFALRHSEPLLQLVDPAYPKCSSDPIVTLQVKALLQANAAHAALALDSLLDPEAAMTLLGEDLPELLRLWLTRQVGAQLRKPVPGQG